MKSGQWNKVVSAFVVATGLIFRLNDTQDDVKATKASYIFHTFRCNFIKTWLYLNGFANRRGGITALRRHVHILQLFYFVAALFNKYKNTNQLHSRQKTKNNTDWKPPKTLVTWKRLKPRAAAKMSCTVSPPVVRFWSRYSDRKKNKHKTYNPFFLKTKTKG